MQKRKPRFLFPRELVQRFRLKLTPAQKKLLVHSQKRRSFLFRRNELGKPVSGTFLKSFKLLEKIVQSDLPRKIKLRERDNWAAVMAMHRIFRAKEAKPGKKINEQELFDEVYEMLKRTFKI